MAWIVDTKSRRHPQAKLAAGLAISALLAVGTLPADARDADQQNLPSVYGRYYAAPPIVYGRPYGYAYYGPPYAYYGPPYPYYGPPYYAPPLVYGPSVGSPGISAGVR